MVMSLFTLMQSSSNSLGCSQKSLSYGIPALEPYFFELMMDTRNGQRKGFPREVASDILRLSLIYEKRHKQSGHDVWAGLDGKYRQELEQLGFQHSPQGFMQASEAGNTRAMQIFLGSGVNLETRDERNWTPLMISSFNGKEAAAFLLIHSGANIDAQDCNGYSPSIGLRSTVTQTLWACCYAAVPTQMHSAISPGQH